MHYCVPVYHYWQAAITWPIRKYTVRAEIWFIGCDRWIEGIQFQKNGWKNSIWHQNDDWNLNYYYQRKKLIHWTTLIIYYYYYYYYFTHHFMADTVWLFLNNLSGFWLCFFFLWYNWVIVQYTEPQIMATIVQHSFICDNNNRFEKDKHIWKLRSSGNKNPHALRAFKKPPLNLTNASGLPSLWAPASFPFHSST